MSAERTPAEQTAETYYDSLDADRFYERIWGGEDIHIGLYSVRPDDPGSDGQGTDGEPDIYAASRRTVERMASHVPDLNSETRVVDLGAGYGGAARWLAKNHGCSVTCVNLSERQNERNARLCQEQGLSDKVEVLHGSFEAIPLADTSVDLVWSQDAFLHSGRRLDVLKEARRVLVPGGHLIFTDPMQADDCPPGVLKPVYDRIHLDSLGSFAFYRKALTELGFEELDCIDLTSQLEAHYSAVGRELRRRADELAQDVSQAYLDRMLQGLAHWVEAAQRGYLAWGVLHFRAC